MLSAGQIKGTVLAPRFFLTRQLAAVGAISARLRKSPARRRSQVICCDRSVGFFGAKTPRGLSGRLQRKPLRRKAIFVQRSVLRFKPSCCGRSAVGVQGKFAFFAPARICPYPIAHAKASQRETPSHVRRGVLEVRRVAKSSAAPIARFRGTHVGCARRGSDQKTKRTPTVGAKLLLWK